MTPQKRLAALFAGNDTHYGTHGEPSRDGSGRDKWIIRPTAKTLKGPYTDKEWKDHLTEGSKRPLGIVPIRTDNTTIWGSIDYDVYGEDLTALIKRVEANKYPLVPCRSKSGGLHLFCFTTEPVPSKAMQDLLRELAASLGIADSEIFPKQSVLLSDRGDQGTWMIMPYFGGDFDGKLRMQYGLRANGAEVGLSEFVRTAEKMRQTPDQINELTFRSTRPTAASPASSGSKTKGKRGKKGIADEQDVPFGDGPPCLIHMVRSGGVKIGSQNNALFHMGVYYKKKFPDTWREELEKANATFLVPAGSAEGLDSVVRSLTKTDYEYKCKDEPMRTHCDAILCRKKTHGVTGTNSGMVPVITSVKKMNTDPPVWFIDLDGYKVECSTEDLQQWNRFQRLLMEVMHNPFGVIPQPVWLFAVQEALKNTEVIEVSEDAQKGGTFKELVDTFLTNRQRGMSEDDLLRGAPWEDEDAEWEVHHVDEKSKKTTTTAFRGRHYFRLFYLKRFLEREGMKNIQNPQILSQIKSLNGGHEKRTIKGKSVMLHWIPSSIVQATPKIGTPSIKDKPI